MWHPFNLLDIYLSHVLYTMHVCWYHVCMLIPCMYVDAMYMPWWYAMMPWCHVNAMLFNLDHIYIERLFEEELKLNLLHQHSDACVMHFTSFTRRRQSQGCIRLHVWGCIVYSFNFILQMILWKISGCT